MAVCKIPLSLLVGLQAGTWTAEQAFAFSLQIADPAERVQALTSLLSCLPQELQTEAQAAALETARATDDKRMQSQMLSNLVDALSEVGKLQQAYLLSDEIDDVEVRAWWASSRSGSCQST